MRTRHMRVGWLGIGVNVFVCTAASAGPSFLRYDEPDPFASTPIQKPSTSFIAQEASDGQLLDSHPLEQVDQSPTVWHALPETSFSSIPADLVATAAVADRAQPLSVPLQFGWLGVLAFTTVGSYLGARWVGIRRNHNG